MGNAAVKNKETPPTNKTNNSGGENSANMSKQSSLISHNKDRGASSINDQVVNASEAIRSQIKHLEAIENLGAAILEKPEIAAAVALPEVASTSMQVSDANVLLSTDTVVEKQTPPLDEKLIDEGPQDQLIFDCALKSACMLVKPESVQKYVTKNVTKLQLRRALPLHFSLVTLLNKFENLKDLDLSQNQMGPQAFRAVCLAMCHNASILSLNMSDNKTDTDTADCIGKMLTENKTLRYLDVSSNYLGKDYFSRKVGQALKENTCLKTLRCESIGMTDCRVLLEGLQSSSSMTDLDMSCNDVSDKAGFGKAFSQWLAKPDCSLRSVSLSRCELDGSTMVEVLKGLQENKSLQEINLNGTRFNNLGQLVSLVVMAAKHPTLTTLCVDSCRCSSADLSCEVPQCENFSKLRVLSLNDCELTDDFITSLEKKCKGKLLCMTEIDLTDNRLLSTQSLACVQRMTADEFTLPSLRRLHYGMNKEDNLTARLKELPNLQYVNIRLCHISHEEVSELGRYVAGSSSNITSLVLDGLKLSGTTCLKEVLANPKTNKLCTMSLGGCALDDNDLSAVCDAFKNGIQLSMLKLSANRITDAGVTHLVDAILKNKSPLAVLDLSNNRIEDDGAKKLVKLFSSKSMLHSLNVSANNIGKEGLCSLVGVVAGKSPLCVLHAQGQGQSQDEGPMVEIYSQLAKSLGYKVQMEGEKVRPGCCDLPANLPQGLLVNLTNMGGHTGSVGQALDSQCIQTDFPLDRLPALSFHHLMQIACFLKGTRRGVWSEAEWNMITGSDRPTTDTPSWLKIASQRDRCIYISNLPGNATLQKLESMLEMDADCSVEETCLMKDPVTRSINGVGWCVMGNQESVKKAITYFNNGEAKIFGQAIMLSEVKVRVDNAMSAEQERLAMEERENRMKLRAKEDSDTGH
ncbi:uncharacterized protein LOC127831603 [Dreissena polymorpha]|uniref:uncharacterized protein LOC127831603 n=1 Tax=Dreissena polymorpha TaxID=45954 RepID=UPI002264CAA0|nr:uncharacterized protein LOC127831603 [Dreissena polymorpha]